MHQFQPKNTVTKFRSSSRSTTFKDTLPPMEHLSDEHKDYANQHNNSHKRCNEKGHHLFDLKESQ